MDENKKLVLAALVILLGANTGDIYRITSGDDSQPKSIDRDREYELRADFTARDAALQRELEKELRLLENRIVVIEVKLGELKGARQ